MGLALLAGCAATLPEARLSERLDERTGITITTLDRPLEFFAPQPELGIDAASFADLGLAEANRMGTRTYYLWISVLWGRNGASRLEAPQPASITIDLGATRLGFDVAQRVHPPVATALYSPAAEWSDQFVFALTIDQARAIAHSPTLALLIATQSGAARAFTLWKPPTESLQLIGEQLLEGTGAR
jgi:hypothetical protein